MQSKYELYRAGLLTTIEIKDIETGDQIQMSIRRSLKDDQSGRDVIDSTLDMFFTPREFKEFLQPMVNHLKERFDNEQSSSESNT
jgi:hypothetical protein